MDENKKIIEVNGIKMEIDMRTVKVIDNFRIGDTIKVLVKGYSDYQSHPGIIVGFDNFKKLPTIIIAYIDAKYSSADLKFVYYNSETKDTEICAANPSDMPIEKQGIIDRMDKEIHDFETKITEVQAKKNYFNHHFNKYFKDFLSERSSRSYCPTADTKPWE